MAMAFSAFKILVNSPAPIIKVAVTVSDAKTVVVPLPLDNSGTLVLESSNARLDLLAAG